MLKENEGRNSLIYEECQRSEWYYPPLKINEKL